MRGDVEHADEHCDAPGAAVARPNVFTLVCGFVQPLHCKKLWPPDPRKHRPQTVCGLCFGVFSGPRILATAMVGESRTQD